jgi:hypothetical protein
MTVEILKVIVWPLTVLLIALALAFLFRSELRSLINRMRRARIPGSSIEFGDAETFAKQQEKGVPNDVTKPATVPAPPGLLPSKAYPYSNKQNETVYFYTANDSQLQQLCRRVVVRGHLPKRAAPAGEGLLVADGVQPRTLLLPERAEPLRARHQEQDAEVQRRRQSRRYHKNLLCAEWAAQWCTERPLLARRLLAKLLPHIPEVSRRVTAAEFGADAKLDVAAL